MARTTRAVWKKRVQRWQRSGQTAARFAARLRVNPNTLKWWRWALAAELQRQTAASAAVEATQFVELVRGTPYGAVEPAVVQSCVESGHETPDERVELRLPTGVRVFLPARFDASAIGTLVAAIERR